MKQGASVSRETSERLALYKHLLLAWNSKINLVSRADEADIDARHIGDSLQLLELIPAGVQRSLDLGSGAGFPGLVLAIAAGITVTLVEADARKCAFLREAARQTGADVAIVNRRIEAADLAAFPLITARALAPLPKLLDMGAQYLAARGTLIFPKGKGVDAEVAEAESGWHMKIERFMSQTGDGVILRISELQRA